MRRGKVLFAAVLLCVIPFTLVNAQRAAGTFSIGGFGGVGMPMGPEFFKDFLKMGIGFGGEFKYNFTEMTSFAASFTYQPFKLDEDKIIEEVTEGEEIPEGMEITVEGGTLKMSIISANLIQYFTPPEASAGFYVTAGGGYYTTKIADAKLKWAYMGESDEMELWKEEDWKPENGFGLDKSGFGINGGLGLEMRLGTNMFLFAEGKYHYTFVEINAIDEEMKEDVKKEFGKLSFITIMGGVRFSP